MGKPNYIVVKDGREFDANGFELSRKGTTSYVGVLVESGQKEGEATRYWAYRTFGNILFYGLYCSENLAECVWVVAEYRKALEANDKVLRNFGRGRGAHKKGNLWGQQFAVPSEFEYDMFTPEALPQKESVSIGNVTRKVLAKETDMTEEFVARQVNTLLGSKVDIKARIAIRDIVVANVEFYNSASDVTAYVNDLVQYKFA